MKIYERFNLSHGPAAVDLRAWREMCESEAYQLLQSRIDYMIEQEKRTLESSDTTVDDWRRAQGAIRALRATKGLGAMIEAEFVNKEK